MLNANSSAVPATTVKPSTANYLHRREADHIHLHVADLTNVRSGRSVESGVRSAESRDAPRSVEARLLDLKNREK